MTLCTLAPSVAHVAARVLGELAQLWRSRIGSQSRSPRSLSKSSRVSPPIAPPFSPKNPSASARFSRCSSSTFSSIVPRASSLDTRTPCLRLPTGRSGVRGRSPAPASRGPTTGRASKTYSAAGRIQPHPARLQAQQERAALLILLKARHPLRPVRGRPVQVFVPHPGRVEPRPNDREQARALLRKRAPCAAPSPRARADARGARPASRSIRRADPSRSGPGDRRAGAGYGLEHLHRRALHDPIPRDATLAIERR